MAVDTRGTNGDGCGYGMSRDGSGYALIRFEGVPSTSSRVSVVFRGSGPRGRGGGRVVGEGRVVGACNSLRARPRRRRTGSRIV